MSAYIEPREHIHILIRAGLDGPRGVPIQPGHWSGISWYASDPKEIEYDPAVPGDYFRQLEAIRRTLRCETADATGQMLTDANVASVAHRYPDDTDETRPGTYDDGRGDWTTPYRYARPPYQPTAAEGLKACCGYEYQACEVPHYRDTEAARFIDALRSALIDKVPGYDEAPWTWGAEELDAARAVGW